MTSICKNCKQEVHQHFCGNCGQETHTHRIDFQYLVHELQHSILHVNKGILYTLKELFRHPGVMIREYIDGRRARHFKPILFVLVLSAIYALLAHYAHLNTSFENTVQVDMSNVENIKAHVLAETITKIYEWLKHEYEYTALLAIPFVAVASYFAFRKSGYNYFEHFVLQCYLSGLTTVVFIVLTLLMGLITHNQKGIGSLTTFAGLFITFWTYNQVFNQNTTLKNIGLTVLSYLYVLLMLLMLLAPVVMILR